MLVSVLQNRLKPIWPSLYHQLKVASHQDGPSMASTSPAGGRSSPPSERSPPGSPEAAAVAGEGVSHLPKIDRHILRQRVGNT